MTTLFTSKGNATALTLELQRLRWSQHQLARASQLRPEIISRLVTGKVSMPYAATRKKVFIALRKRAAELEIPPPNEVNLFPAFGEPATYHDQWQETLLAYALHISWTQHLTEELEPLALLHTRFELARCEAAIAPPGTLGQWAKVADVVYYAVQRAALGDSKAIQEAQLILSQVHLSWKEAVVAALAKYALRSRRAEKKAESEWQVIVCSLQALEEDQG
jgi:transcriptional regulator with XRE-family HTH domain